MNYQPMMLALKPTGGDVKRVLELVVVPNMGTVMATMEMTFTDEFEIEEQGVEPESIANPTGIQHDILFGGIGSLYK
jgi:hypothetical protein